MKAVKISGILLAVAFASLVPLAAHAYTTWYVDAGDGKTKFYDSWGWCYREAKVYPVYRDVYVRLYDRVNLYFDLNYNDATHIYGGTQQLSWKVYVNGSYHGWGYTGKNTGGWETKSGTVRGYYRVIMAQRGWNYVQIRLEAYVKTSPDGGWKKKVGWSTIWVYVY